MIQSAVFYFCKLMMKIYICIIEVTTTRNKQQQINTRKEFTNINHKIDHIFFMSSTQVWMSLLLARRTHSLYMIESSFWHISSPATENDWPLELPNGASLRFSTWQVLWSRFKQLVNKHCLPSTWHALHNRFQISQPFQVSQQLTPSGRWVDFHGERNRWLLWKNNGL